jgi:hypothetical protein
VESASRVSYPPSGNEMSFLLEKGHFLFEHRSHCILSAVNQFPPAGTLFDIAAGNGLLASKLQSMGIDVALVETGDGVHNALQGGGEKW